MRRRRGATASTAGRRGTSERECRDAFSRTQRTEATYDGSTAGRRKGKDAISSRDVRFMCNILVGYMQGDGEHAKLVLGAIELVRQWDRALATKG